MSSEADLYDEIVEHGVITQAHLDFLLYYVIIQDPIMNRRYDTLAYRVLRYVSDKNKAPTSTDIDDIVHSLLKNGANPNQRFFQGFTALQRAMDISPTIFELLLMYGGDPFLINHNNALNMLQEAVMHGNREVARLIAKHYPKDKRTEIELLMGGLTGNMWVVSTMLYNGVNIDAVDPKTGDTALHYAAMKGIDKVVEHLINKGADCTVENKEGKTFIDVAMPQKVRLYSGMMESMLADARHASMENRNETVLLMLNSKTTPAIDVIDIRTGNTALHRAAMEGDDRGVETLLRMRADGTVKDRDGKTFIEVAPPNKKTLYRHMQFTLY